MFAQSDSQLHFSFLPDFSLMVQRQQAQISCDAGLLPIRQFDQRHHYTARMTACLSDARRVSDALDQGGGHRDAELAPRGGLAGGSVAALGHCAAVSQRALQAAVFGQAPAADISRWARMPSGP